MQKATVFPHSTHQHCSLLSVQTSSVSWMQSSTCLEIISITGDHLVIMKCAVCLDIIIPIIGAVCCLSRHQVYTGTACCHHLCYLSRLHHLSSVCLETIMCAVCCVSRHHLYHWYSLLSRHHHLCYLSRHHDLYHRFSLLSV